jgi:hypothetical protein
MPYVNGRLWDTENEIWKSENAVTGAVKNISGNACVENYPWKIYRNGQIAERGAMRAAVMCPASNIWKNKLSDIAVKLHDGHGCGGVYFDQIGAAWPVFCNDASHGHPLGNGDYWAEGHKGMVEKIKGKLGAGFFVTTECCAEPYLNIFDGFLMDTNHPSIGGNTVPLIPAVYSGYWLPFNHSLPRRNWSALAVELARMFHYGANIGGAQADVWADTKSVPEKAPGYYKELLALRKKTRDFFLYGEFLHPVKIVTLAGPADVPYENGVSKTAPSVFGSVWKKDAEMILILTNVSPETVKFSCRMEKRHYISDGRKMTVKEESGQPSLMDSGSELGGELTLPAYRTLIIKFLIS